MAMIDQLSPGEMMLSNGGSAYFAGIFWFWGPDAREPPGFPGLGGVEGDRITWLGGWSKGFVQVRSLPLGELTRKDLLQAIKGYLCGTDYANEGFVKHARASLRVSDWYAPPPVFRVRGWVRVYAWTNRGNWYLIHNDWDSCHPAADWD